MPSRMAAWRPTGRRLPGGMIRAMTQPAFTPSPYRWAVLAVVMLVNLTMQMLWIGYAAITGPAAEFYGVSDVAVGVFAMSFMLAFLPLSLPASWLIDTRGFRIAVGPRLRRDGRLRRAARPGRDSYPWALAATIGIAAAQPLLLNAWTAMPARWFPAGQRATAVGVTTLGNLLGTAIGLVASPALLAVMPVDRIQLVYGIARRRQRGPVPGGRP